MKLQNQVTSLELSKKLKELGVKQESFWHWEFYTELGSSELPSWHLVQHIFGKKDDKVSAFTVAELGEMLPEYFCSARAGTVERWICEKFSHGHIDAVVPRQYADTEANARAKCLIYLIENKLITL